MDIHASNTRASHSSEIDVNDSIMDSQSKHYYHDEVHVCKKMQTPNDDIDLSLHIENTS